MVLTLESPLPHPALTHADWGDAYAVTLARGFSSAREAGEAVVKAFPVWTFPLLCIRNIIVLPFGLKGTKAAAELLPDPISFFPVQKESNDEVIAGFDDKHLDFRLIIDVQTKAETQQLRLTTVIHRNNLLGRVYLALVIPFHRVIIKSALAKLQRQQR